MTQVQFPFGQFSAEQRPVLQVTSTPGQSGAEDSTMLKEPNAAPPRIGRVLDPGRRGVKGLTGPMPACAALPRRAGRSKYSDSPGRDTFGAAFPDLLPPPGVGIFRIRLATERWELHGCARLRRAVFCDEQRLFTGSDGDAHDEVAQPIAAVSYAMGMADEVVGTVRIHEEAPGVWFGSRLAVAQEWRGVHGLSSGLIRAAVCTAHARGCQTFLATVQRQNVPMFRRLRWRSLQEIEVCGKPHQLMQADLSFYPATDEKTPATATDGMQSSTNRKNLWISN